MRGFGCVQPTSSSFIKEAEKLLISGFHGIGEVAYYFSDIDIKSLIRLCKLISEANSLFLLHTNDPVGHTYPGKSPINLTTIYNLVKYSPKTRIILAHMSGGLFMYSIMKKDVTKILHNVWIDTAAAPFLYNTYIYTLAIKLLGAQKILLGTDYPLLRMSRYINDLANANISEHNISQIKWKSAYKLII